MSEGTGRALKPANQNKVNAFGQVNNAEEDATSGYVPSPHESNLAHKQSDVDSGPRSQHHTLGKGRNQASPGSHIHDGISSQKLGPMKMDPTGNATVPELTLTGSKGGNAALANLINMLKTVINFNDNTT